ncbi:hypothetical protein ES703_71006 [subsurface metagenome]
MTTKPETAVRSWQNFLTMAVGAGVGYGMNYGLIRLGARFRDMFTTNKILEAADAALVGTGLAAVVYMGLMLFGWSKSGLVGDFLVGFGAGALADELLSSGVMGGS